MALGACFYGSQALGRDSVQTKAIEVFAQSPKATAACQRGVRLRPCRLRPGLQTTLTGYGNGG
jgi:hypothetical protein